ncbi:hypothetical protein WMY93_026969 [Mugilogobius chulae]|uniref:SAM domain-containing protein n=1 Tax=Mugilogobius chulae TaxID=88201 RepID=A0AAW0MTE1_9GOBI
MPDCKMSRNKHSIKEEFMESDVSKLGLDLDLKVSELGLDLDLKVSELGLDLDLKVSELGLDLDLKVNELGLDLDLKVSDFGLDLDLKVSELGLDLDLKVSELGASAARLVRAGVVTQRPHQNVRRGQCWGVDPWKTIGSGSLFYTDWTGLSVMAGQVDAVLRSTMGIYLITDSGLHDQSVHTTDFKPSPSSIPSPNINMRKRRHGEEEIYYIPVRGRENYELLMKIKDSLELMELVPQPLVDSYRQQTQQQLIQRPSNIASPSSYSPLSNMNKLHGGLNKAPSVTQLVGQSQQNTHMVSSLWRQVQVKFQVKERQIQVKTVRFPLRATPFFGVTDTVKDKSGGMLNNHHMQTNGDMNGGHGNQTMCPTAARPPNYNPDPGLVSFLTNLGCQNFIDYFTSQGFQSVYHLQTLSMEDLGALKIPEQSRLAIWRGLQDMKQASVPMTPTGHHHHDYHGQQLLRSSSNMAMATLGAGGGELQRQRVMEAVHFRVRHTITIPNRAVGAGGVTATDEWADFGFDMPDCKMSRNKHSIKEEFMESDVH